MIWKCRLRNGGHFVSAQCINSSLVVAFGAVDVGFGINPGLMMVVVTVIGLSFSLTLALVVQLSLCVPWAPYFPRCSKPHNSRFMAWSEYALADGKSEKAKRLLHIFGDGHLQVKVHWLFQEGCVAFTNRHVTGTEQNGLTLSHLSSLHAASCRSTTGTSSQFNARHCSQRPCRVTLISRMCSRLKKNIRDFERLSLSIRTQVLSV